MTRFAQHISVSPQRTQEEIERLLARYGADAFGVLKQTAAAAIMFEVRRLHVRIDVPLPAATEKRFTHGKNGRRRWGDPQQHREAEVRQRWRALLLVVKAKLEAVESGISTLETEFMPFIVLPDGRTLKDHLLPKLAEVAATGKMPRLGLPAPHELEAAR